MKIILEYNTEEEALAAINGWRKQAAIDEVGNEVFRPARKHGYGDTEINTILAHLDGLCEQDVTPEGLWARDLIHALERKFWEIMNDTNT